MFAGEEIVDRFTRRAAAGQNGGYLMGDVDALALHTANAFVVTALDVVQLVCAIVFFWKGRGRAWPI